MVDERHREIEPRIKPLADILNEVPYIETNQSSEGNYDSNDYEDYRAYVGFFVEDEK